MVNPTPSGILGRKANSARQQHEARTMTPTKALRRALSRTADRLWDLALVVQGVERGIFDQEECVSQLPEDVVLILLEGRNGDLGLAAISRPVVMALVEVQTIGVVTEFMPDNRPFTYTDAAMVAPLLDGCLENLEGQLEGLPEQELMGGYRFGVMVDDARTAGLVLDSAEYRAFRLLADMEGGRKNGEVLFLFPEVPKQEPEVEVDDSPGPTKGLHEDSLSLVPFQIRVLLPPIRLPLSKASGLAAGDVLRLPPDFISEAEVHAGLGQKVASGRLGQMNGHWAIRLDLPDDGDDLPVEPDLDSQNEMIAQDDVFPLDKARGLPIVAPDIETAEPLGHNGAALEEDLDFDGLDLPDSLLDVAGQIETEDWAEKA